MIKFAKNTDTDCLADKPKYQGAIGCLTYLMNATRPDIAAALNVLSQFVSCPSHQLWSGVKKIVRYLSGNRDHGLVFIRGNTKIEAFSDSDYSGCSDTYCSRFGFCVRICEAVFSWRSQKQKSASRSTSEAEYNALGATFHQILWIEKLLAQLGLGDRMVQMNVDNQSAIQLCKNQRYHDRSKHIKIEHSFIREHVNNGDITV